MLLTNKEIAAFVVILFLIQNKHCISYGMFDSSDDYEVVQKYLPMKDLPAFALFKFNKKEQKEDFISSYVLCCLIQVVLQKDAKNFMEWIAMNIGVPIKKKENSMMSESSNKVESSVNGSGFRPSDIIYQQNLEYEEMAKLYQMKRDISKVKKEEVASKRE